MDWIARMFISYRSPSYNELRKNGCKILNSQECTLQNAAYCSYKKCSFRRAAVFSMRQNYKTIIVPPLYILSPDVLLSVKDFFRYCPSLQQCIGAADIFVKFEIEKDSFWTLIEENLWRSKCYRKNMECIVNDIKLDYEGNTQHRQRYLAAMDKSEFNLYWRLIHYIQPENIHDHGWGKYADCFVQVCPSCGQIFLISLSALKFLYKNDLGLSCPACRCGNFAYHYDWSAKYPVRFNYKGPHNLNTTLDPDLMIRLLLDTNSKAPAEEIPLICLSTESFPDGIAFSQMMGMLADIFRKIVVTGYLELRIYDSNRHRINRWALTNPL